MYRFEIFKDESKQYRFRLVAGNNEIVATSEAYTQKKSCTKTVGMITLALETQNWKLVDLTRKAQRSDNAEMQRSPSDESVMGDIIKPY